MKLFCVVALALVAVCAGEGYTSDKNLDIAALIGDPKSLKEMVSCFSGKSDCNEAVVQIKKDLPEALAEACAKCTPEQKHNVRLFLDALKEKLPAEYKEFKSTYDADNKLFPKLEEAIASF